MKPFQNKMSHNYRPSFNASRLVVMVGVEGVGGGGGNWQECRDIFLFKFFFPPVRAGKNAASRARDDV